jgi:aminoglycoside/choline kinase family phosphotransferase
VKVPDIYAYDLVQGFYCQQDFGDNLFSDELNLSTADNLYKKALDCLPSIQSCQSIDQKPLPIFDRAMVEREFLLFTDWLLNKYLALELTSEQRLMVQDSLDIISHQFLSQPTAGVHRDYHSRNLMLLVNNEVGVIDFQDAVIGPITYDAVSLLRDCYQAWPVEKVVQWLKAWHQTNFSEYDWAQLLVWFDFTGLQRHIKASGIFARLYLRDNKSVYLGDIPRTLQYIIDIAAKYPQLRPFSEFVASVVLPAVRSQREK